MSSVSMIFDVLKEDSLERKKGLLRSSEKISGLDNTLRRHVNLNKLASFCLAASLILLAAMCEHGEVVRRGVHSGIIEV
jgi:hypothetical protein